MCGNQKKKHSFIHQTNEKHYFLHRDALEDKIIEGDLETFEENENIFWFIYPVYIGVAMHQHQNCIHTHLHIDDASEAGFCIYFFGYQRNTCH